MKLFLSGTSAGIRPEDVTRSEHAGIMLTFAELGGTSLLKSKSGKARFEEYVRKQREAKDKGGRLSPGNRASK